MNIATTFPVFFAERGRARRCRQPRRLTAESPGAWDITYRSDELPLDGTQGASPGTIEADGRLTLTSSAYTGAIVDTPFAADFTLVVVSYTSTTTGNPESYKYVICGVATKASIAVKDFVYNDGGICITR